MERMCSTSWVYWTNSVFASCAIEDFSDSDGARSESTAILMNAVSSP